MQPFINQVFSQTTTYSPNDFCNVTDDDCTVTLGVNWKPNTHSITYRDNGSTGYHLSSIMIMPLYNNKFIYGNPTRNGYKSLGLEASSKGNVVYTPGKQWDVEMVRLQFMCHMGE